MAHCGRVYRKVFTGFWLKIGIFITLSLKHDAVVLLKNGRLEDTAYIVRFSVAICECFAHCL